MSHYVIPAILVLIGLLSFNLFRKKKVENFVKKSIAKSYADYGINLPKIEKIYVSYTNRKKIKNQRQYRKYLRSNPNQNRFK